MVCSAVDSFVVGMWLIFAYPRANYHGVHTYYERRRILIEEVRRLEDAPLAAETLELNPLVRRGPVLVRGFDFDKWDWRSFYASSMRDVRTGHMDEAFSVAWASGQWQYGEPIPEDFRLEWRITKGICEPFAEALADSGNRLMALLGRKNRWLMPVEMALPLAEQPGQDSGLGI